MRGSVVRVTWAEDDDAAGLKAAYSSEKDGRVKPRLHGLWLIRSGMQVQEAAHVVGVNERTAKQWVAWYREGGLERVRSRRRGGKGQARRLSPEQEAALQKRAATEGFGTVKEAAAWVKQAFGVEYSEAGMGGVFSRLGLRQKVPRPKNVKAAEQTQAEWKKGG